ncbi:hypothetical protein [uncultured Granulicatella sp.]|jgi:hypothetical protein|uniref:hypothetical protein n=1 Tax=uncultured Granulicatella sp. TaxID=316089 RepID=UPI00261A6177|nr:hypothetical protein [uncultured Granulicatella sp.]
MDETTIRIAYDFKIIPFDDALWKLAFKNLRDKFNIEQITLIKTKVWNTGFHRFYDVYVDKVLIEKCGYGAVVEMVQEKIKEQIDEEMELDFSFLTKK